MRPAESAFPSADSYRRAVARWDSFGELRERVRELLSEEEWAAARRNTLNAHYTSADLVQAVWGAVRGLGFQGGRVLEPGSGSGNFIGFAPDLPHGVQMTGVEVEPTTAAIARHLYPDAEIITSGLEKVRLADGGFDAVVGNVPYGRYARFDETHNPDLKLSIHDHFILKSLHAARPGGIVALITSRYTLDAEDPAARERMYELGDLVGAVRLPTRAHKEAAGADVVTDVLFLRRRAEGEEPGDATWLTSRKRVLPGHDGELAVNAYYGVNPEYVLGELRARLGQYGWEVTVTDRGDRSPAAALQAAAAAIAVEAQAEGLTASDDHVTDTGPMVLSGGAEGALGLDAAGNPTIVDGGRAVPLEIHPSQHDKLVQLIRLKAMTQSLYEAEAATTEPGETPQLARMRTELRTAYRAYRKNNPPLAKPRQPFKFTPAEAKNRAAAEGLKDVPEAWKHRTAYAWIDDDPDASLLFGLEEWDDKTKKATEQQVLFTRVLEPRRLPTRATTPEDAIALAMEWDGGRLDMARVASLLGLDEDSAAAQCADAGLAFRDPEQGDAWEPRHRYLSGNVRTKLTAARERAADDPSFIANAAALEQVQPQDLAPSEIKAKIGAPWIPVDVYNDFLGHLGFEDASVVHAGGTTWEVRGARVGDLARTEWGTPQRPAQDLIQALLRQTDSLVTVTYTDSEGRTYTDQDATDAAREKARLIAQAFEDWVWDDPARAARLAQQYNEQFNNLVLPEYSDLPLTLPGLISDWEMREHQNAAIRRIVNEPTALLAHVVGAGKTATMAAGAMELRRTGLAKKPALIVPNHMLKQWTREFRQLYPNAKLLAITASDLGKKRRTKFMARIAGGDWDAVILTHEAFTRVPLRPETQRDYLDREMASLRQQLDAATEAGMNDRTVKQIENTLANAEANLEQQITATSGHAGVFLEDTGIDYLFLDEAHEFKNLRTISAIPGAQIDGAAKATKLHTVLSWLRETSDSGRVATLATGTPIANSVTEAYVLMRYLAPQLLDELGLDAFDNWAATFGEVVSSLEPDAKGGGYKWKARFSRFFNVPELMAAYRTFADVRMAEDLNLPTPTVRQNEEGQRGETVVIAPTPAQREFIKQLPNQPWVNKPGGVLKALGEGLRASLDLDLVDASDALATLGIDARPADGGKEMGSKLPTAAEKIAVIWRESKDIVYPVSKDDPTPQPLPGGLQLVFLDEGTPGSTAKHGANLYADLRDQLVEHGLPYESIRFVHEANTDRQKEKLFADCRAGRVSVLIGSTAKMGTGTNIQDRAVALHHLSYPWRPADMEQRDGRIERRGNLNVPWVDGTPDDVRIIYYITERTFDEFRLTTLARKARFISQIQRRDFNLREIEDIGADAINLGLLSALASGDPAILHLAEATAERARLQGLARSWDRQQDSRAQQLNDLDDFLKRADAALEGMRAVLPNRRPTSGDAFAMTVDGTTHRTRDTAANALGDRMVALARDQSLRPGQQVPIGSLGGLDFHGEIGFDGSGRRQLRLRFAWGHVVPLGHRDDRAQWQASTVTPANGRGAIQSLERFLSHLDEDTGKLDTSAAAQRSRRQEIAANLRPKEENPYRIHARSKEREEAALGKLVVANEKAAALTDRAQRAASVNPGAAEEADEELATVQEEIARLRQTIADEHAIQEQAQTQARAERRPEEAEANRQSLQQAAAVAEARAGATEAVEEDGQPVQGDLIDAAVTEGTDPGPLSEPERGTAADEPAAGSDDTTGRTPPTRDAEQSAAVWWIAASDEEVPEGYVSFTDASARLQEGDLVRIGSRRHMEDTNLVFHTVTVTEGPDQDGYYIGAGETGARGRFHPDAVVAVPDDSRLLTVSAPETDPPPAPSPEAADTPVTPAPETPDTEAPRQSRIDNRNKDLTKPGTASHSGGGRQVVSPDEQAAAPKSEPDASAPQDALSTRLPEPTEPEHRPDGKPTAEDSEVDDGEQLGLFTSTDTNTTPDAPDPADAGQEAQPSADTPVKTAVAPAPGADPNEAEPAASNEAPARETQQEEAGPLHAPASDRQADEAPEQEEAVEVSEEPASTTTNVPVADRLAQGAAPASEELDGQAQEGDGAAVDVQDPPAPRHYTEVIPLAADADFKLHLFGQDGQGAYAGELQYKDTTVATLHTSEDGWYARVTVDGQPEDLTYLSQTPQDAADQGAVLFSVLTNTPYGERTTAAADEGDLSRADVLRTELQETALRHRETILSVAARVSADGTPDARFRELDTQLIRMVAAAQDEHSSRQMAAHLNGIRLTTDDLGRALPPDPSADERRLLFFPLAHLRYDTTRLQARLQAALDTAQTGGATRAEGAEGEARRVAAPTADAVPEPSAPGAPDQAGARANERLQAAAETALARAQQDSRSDNQPEPPAQTRGESMQDRALAQAATAPSRDQQDLPLWTGTDLPTGTWREDDGTLYDAYGVPQWRLKTAPPAQPATQTPASDSPATPPGGYEPVDIKQSFTSTVAEAWADIVPPEHGTAEDLLEAVDVPLREMEEQWQRAVPAPVTDGGQRAEPTRAARDASPPARRDPEPVNAALRQADTHDDTLRNLPEWQQLQTVRGAATHLWNVLRERAGAYFEQLRSDVRVQGFWRTVSLRTTSKIAEWAQAAADRLRAGRRGGDLPTAEALLKLSETALTYSTPGIPRPDQPDPDTRADGTAAEVRQLRTTLRSGAPVPYGTREEATQASREIAEAFQAWRETPMGKELTTASEHPRLVAFREAWQRLPPADLPNGPGTAAGPYGDVGRTAQDLAERAEVANTQRAQAGQPPRFATADVEALRAVATLAEHHGGRLAVTLPPGPTGPAVSRPTAPPMAVPRPKVAAPTAPAATAGARSVSA